MSPLSTLRPRARPTTDYERWLSFNPDEDPSAPPKYGPDRTHRYVDDSSVRFAPNRQLMLYAPSSIAIVCVPSNNHSNGQRHMPSGHTRHHRRIAHSQALVRGITFFCAVLVVLLVMRMFVLSLIRASRRRRDIERQIQEASQGQHDLTVYEDNNELNELWLFSIPSFLQFSIICTRTSQPMQRWPHDGVLAASGQISKHRITWQRLGSQIAGIYPAHVSEFSWRRIRLGQSKITRQLDSSQYACQRRGLD